MSEQFNSPNAVTQIARAKINLFLHVGATRPDGLHEIDSLFVFADAGDVLTISPAPILSLEIDGPFAAALGDLAPNDNIVMKAARLLAKEAGVKNAGAHIHLRKNLPVAAGIGGGSADAAAALCGLAELWGTDISAERLHGLAFSLGADVPACLSGAPLRVQGAGEITFAAPNLPPLWVALVNPRVAMPTGPIFRDFDATFASPSLPTTSNASPKDYGALSHYFTATRNDLEPFARARAPQIGDVLGFLASQPGSLASRMSGSGATCFALFNSNMAAQRAALGAQANGWWSVAAKLCR